MTQEMQKQALGFGFLSNIPRKSLEQAARMGVGGTAGYFGNNAYLNEVNPDVTDMGRARSNVMSAIIAAGLSSRGAVPAMLRRPAGTALGAGALGLRYGVLMPDLKHGGLGDIIDPGKSKIQRGVSALWNPDVQNSFNKFIETGPVHNTAEFAKDKGVRALNWLLDYKGKKGDKPSYQEQMTAGLKDTVLPITYSSLITSLGGKPSEKPTFSDVGMALAPHLTGGAGGGYLGYLLSRAAGNYMFRDNPRDDYEERRRQDNRRYWLNFLGSNLGVLGGVLATAKAMPQLNAAIGKYVSQGAEKKGSALHKEAGPGWLSRALKGFGKDVAVGSGITAGQYFSGMVPPATYDKDGVGQGTSYGLAVPLLALNSALATRARTTFGKPTYYNVRHNAPGLLPGGTPGKIYKNPLTDGLTLATGVTAGPAILNTFSAGWPLWNLRSKFTEQVNDPRSPVSKEIGDLGGTINKTWEGKDGLKDTLKTQFTDRAKKTLSESGVPGFDKKQLGQFLTAGVLSSIAQGTGIVGGGFAGMLGTNYVMDKLLSLATKKKWLKKRPRVHAFIRDLASLIGAGAGAYGTMRLMNYGIPALANRNAAKGTDAAKPEATGTATPAAAAGAEAAAQLQAPAPATKALKTESK